jgi:hypothetical protein
LEIGLPEPTVVSAAAAMTECDTLRGRDAGGKGMKAILSDRYGSDEVLEERTIERPEVGDNQVPHVARGR